MEPKNPLENSSNPKSGANSLDGLQRTIPRVKITSTLQEIEDGTIPNEDPKKENVKDIKKELNALVAFSIQEIWNGIFKDGRQESFVGSYYLLQQEVEGISIKISSNANEVLHILEEEIKATLISHIQRWYIFHSLRINKNADSEIVLDNSDKAFQRYQTVILERVRINPTHEALEEIQSQITAGVNTAIRAIFDVLQDVPALYKRKFGQAIRRQDLKNIVKESLPLLMKIASSEIKVFQGLRQAGKDGMFRLVEEGGKQKLDLDPKVVKQIEEEDLSNQLRTGCPAIVAKGTDGKSMLVEFFDYVMCLAEKHYFPYFKND